MEICEESFVGVFQVVLLPTTRTLFTILHLLRLRSTESLPESHFLEFFVDQFLEQQFPLLSVLMERLLAGSESERVSRMMKSLAEYGESGSGLRVWKSH